MTKKQKSKNNKKRRPRRRERRVVPKSQLSTVSQSYLMGLQRPFECRRRGIIPHIPLGANFPSHKFSTFTRFEAQDCDSSHTTVLTTYQLSPYADQSQIRYSSNLTTYSGTIDIPDLVGMEDAGWSTTPYAVTPTTPINQQFRLVGLGIRLTYAGTELNKGGLVYALRHVNDNLTPDQVRAHPNTHTYSIQDYPSVDITWAPMTEPTEWHNGGVSELLSMVTIVIDHAVDAQLTFVEVIGHFELTGENTASAPTHSPTDVVGANAVLSAHHIIQPGVTTKYINTKSSNVPSALNTAAGSISAITSGLGELGVGMERAMKAVEGFF